MSTSSDQHDAETHGDALHANEELRAADETAAADAHAFDEECDLSENFVDRANEDDLTALSGSCGSDIPAGAWAVSVCFWSTLALAAVLYAAVSLSPKLSVWMTARNEYARNSQDLASLEEKVEYLERVCHALDTDPDFLQRMSQSSGATVRTSDGSELIPVSGDLLFGYDDAVALEVTDLKPTRTVRFARLLGSHRGLRTGLLGTATFLTLFAFAFLNDAGSGFVESAGRLIRWGISVPIRRYLQREDGAEESVESEITEA